MEYYEAALQKNGERTPDFLRLFMVPGMTHCQGGNATDTFDAMTALINWVEKGKAPDAILAARVFEGRVARTRPLCPYPQVARYSGKGSIDDCRQFQLRGAEVAARLGSPVGGGALSVAAGGPSRGSQHGLERIGPHLIPRHGQVQLVRLGHARIQLS